MLFDIIEGMTPHIAIITVVYNNYTVLEDFLKSLEAQTNQEFHLYIADASDMKHAIQSEKIKITVIPCSNLGYANGINLGIREALKRDIKNFCVINNDVFFNPDFIQNIADSFNEHPGTVFGGKIYYAPGFEFHKQYSQPELGHVLWYAGGILDWKNAYTLHRGVDEVDQGRYDLIEKTEFITGCFICFDSQVVKAIGLWDEKYFLYYEDADYCERAKQAGIELLYIPKLILWHKNAQSTGGSGSKIHEQFMEKAHLRFGLKYAPLRTRLHLVKNQLFPPKAVLENKS